MSVWFAISGCTNEVKVRVNVTENHILASSRPNISVGRRKVRVIYPCSTHVFLITKCLCTVLNCEPFQRYN